jgi:hypothetical protein
MKVVIRLMTIAAGLLMAQSALAQAPAGSTGQCKDGTYTTSASKSGACRGHQGIKEWYGTAPAAPASSAKPTSKSANATPPPSTPASPPAAAANPAAGATTPKATHTSTSNMAQAPGGGPGMVWLNTDSNIYHCPGTQYYGKTKQGAYMSEADAKAKGAHADHNHPCTK